MCDGLEKAHRGTIFSLKQNIVYNCTVNLNSAAGFTRIKWMQIRIEGMVNAEKYIVIFSNNNDIYEVL